MTAYYVERDIDDNITLEVEITNDVVVNITPVQNSVVIIINFLKGSMFFTMK